MNKRKMNEVRLYDRLFTVSIFCRNIFWISRLLFCLPYLKQSSCFYCNIKHRARAEVIDFTAPYFHSGVTLLAAPKTKTEIPLLAFLLPFSPELWIAIFTSLNITAVAVAVYEWLSPFGLNPWGRQRSKNFSMSSGKLKWYAHLTMSTLYIVKPY